MSTKRPIALIAAILTMSTLALAGCTSGQDSGSTSASYAPGAESGSGAPGVAMDQKSPVDPSQAQADRKEIVTGSVTLTAKDPIDSSHRAASRVTALGGRVDQRTEYPETDDNRASSELVVRVPADKTDQFVDELSDFGTVTNISLSRSDVTMQHQDLNARVKALQTSVTRLQSLLESATETSDLIEIETALSQRQAELDSLTAQLRGLDDQIGLSTITLSFSTVDQRPPSDPDSFLDGLADGWNALVSVLHSAMVNTGRALPFLGLLAIIGLAVWGIVRAIVNASTKRSPTAPSRPGMPQYHAAPPYPTSPVAPEKNADNGPDQAK